jgi:polar amino acid transport system substrate-binding protein
MDPDVALSLIVLVLLALILLVMASQNASRFLQRFAMPISARCVVVKTLMLFLLSFSPLSAVLADSSRSLHIVTEAWPPLVYEKAGQPKGPLWEVCQAVLHRMGYEVHLSFVPWKRALDLVTRGQRDGVLGASSNPEREKRLRFPEQWLMVSKTRVFSTREHPVDYQGLDSYKGLRIGVSAGYEYAGPVATANSFERLEVPGVSKGLRLLSVGRVDAFIVNTQVGWFEARRLGLADKVLASDETSSGGPVYLAFARNLPASLVDLFDHTRGAFRVTRAYQRIMQDYQPPTPGAPVSPGANN